MPRTKVVVILMLVLWGLPVFAQSFEEAKIPDEVKPFVGQGFKAVALESADLNGDGKSDFVLVLDTTKEDDEADEADRPVLILTRGTDGKLALAARNDAVVYCRECGGVYGDPFDSVKVVRNGFTVSNIGGSSDRWVENHEFRYSRRDRTWQLVRSVFKTYNVFSPKKMKTRILTPKNFGKVNFADFSLTVFQEKSTR